MPSYHAINGVFTLPVLFFVSAGGSEVNHLVLLAKYLQVGNLATVLRLIFIYTTLLYEVLILCHSSGIYFHCWQTPPIQNYL